jgi:sugar transferase (PEP-CTERM/EpsH1 system associated)
VNPLELATRDVDQTLAAGPLPNHDAAPLVVHILYRFAVGGVENGLVNLINHIPPEAYRHAIVCLCNYSADFCARLRRPNVPIIALHKRAGHDLGVHLRLWRVLRALRPDIVHTRNLSGLECMIPAVLANVPGRIHGEHGRDVYDLDGSNRKYNVWRKAIRPLVQRYIAVSADLADWLVHTVGVRMDQVVQIYNGVDTQRFHPRCGLPPTLAPEGFVPPGAMVVGTVGRMQAVKDQVTLVRSFLHLLQTVPDAHQRLRLVLIGDGPLREEIRQLLQVTGAEHLVWLAGERTDIPELMRTLDLFVLPSLAEGISNTILEAMASGVPVLATRVGGNPELVQEGVTGRLVPPANPVAMAKAMHTYLVDAGQLRRHGQAGRQRVEARFSMEAMVTAYLAVYHAVLRGTRSRQPGKRHGNKGTDGG